MALTLVKVTGTVTNVDSRSGVSKAGNEYSITEVDVLVNQRGVTTVRWDDSPTPSLGSNVEVWCDVTAFRDRPQFRVDSHMTDNG